MDDRRFDALSRRIAASGTRRGLIKTLAGLFLGGSAAAMIADGADAVSCRAPFQACTKGNQCCSGTCHDARHPDRTLRSTCACIPGTTPCNGACIDLLNDPNHCGACGHACPTDSGNACLGGAICQTGVCGFAPLLAGSPCSDGSACTNPDTCDGNGTCLPGGPTVCEPLDQCHDAGTCDPMTGLCSNPEKADESPCDDGNACTENDYCLSGFCHPGSTVNCGTAKSCEWISCDPDEGCIQQYKPTGYTCSDGTACNGDELCDGAGTCLPGTPIDCSGVFPNADGICINGECELDECNSGYGNCNMVASDGCETDTNTSNTHCGTCNHACVNGEVCEGGACGEPGPCVTCPENHYCDRGTCLRIYPACDTSHGCSIQYAVAVGTGQYGVCVQTGATNGATCSGSGDCPIGSFCEAIVNRCIQGCAAPS